MAEIWPGRFSGTRVVVTGGASGIGEATVARFLREGADMLVFDIDATALGACAGRHAPGIAEGAGRLLTHRGDVTVPADFDDMLALAVDQLGGVDVLVSNAGIAYEEPFLDIPLQHWTRTIDVNLTSMFFVCQRVARHMAERSGDRSILLTSSTNGLVGETSTRTTTHQKAA